MEYKITVLSHEHLNKLLPQVELGVGVNESELRRSYFSLGSVSYCLLADNVPVLAGGIVNVGWRRGEAWMLPTPFFRRHVKDCYRYIKNIIPRMAEEGHFRRLQASCVGALAARFSAHLGFEYEGVLRCFGANGEDCLMHSRIF